MLDRQTIFQDARTRFSNCPVFGTVAVKSYLMGNQRPSVYRLTVLTHFMCLKSRESSNVPPAPRPLSITLLSIVQSERLNIDENCIHQIMGAFGWDIHIPYKNHSHRSIGSRTNGQEASRILLDDAGLLHEQCRRAFEEWVVVYSRT